MMMMNRKRKQWVVGLTAGHIFCNAVQSIFVCRCCHWKGGLWPSSSSRNLNLCSSLGDAVVLRQKLLPLKDILIVVIIIIIIITYKSWLSSSSPSSWNLMFPKLSRGQVQIDVFSGSEKLVAPDDENTAMCHGGPQMTFQMFRYNVCPNLISHPYQEYFLIFSIYADQTELKTFDIQEQNL